MPLSNAALYCGTGVDFVAYDAEIEGYNERILAAHTEGETDQFSLKHKLRTREAMDALFAKRRSVRLEKDGQTLEVAGGTYTIKYVQKHGELEWSHATRPHYFIFMHYPEGSGRWPDELPRGPFDVLIQENDTTAILRDAERCVWVIDLPRAVVVQVVPPSE